MKRLLIVLICACVLLCGCASKTEKAYNKMVKYVDSLDSTICWDENYNWYYIDNLSSQIIIGYNCLLNATEMAIFIKKDSNIVNFRYIIQTGGSIVTIEGYIKKDEYLKDSNFIDDIYVMSYDGDTKEEHIEKTADKILETIQNVSKQILKGYSTDYTFNSLGFIYVTY